MTELTIWDALNILEYVDDDDMYNLAEAYPIFNEVFQYPYIEELYERKAKNTISPELLKYKTGTWENFYFDALNFQRRPKEYDQRNYHNNIVAIQYFIDNNILEQIFFFDLIIDSRNNHIIEFLAERNPPILPPANQDFIVTGMLEYKNFELFEYLVKIDRAYLPTDSTVTSLCFNDKIHAIEYLMNRNPPIYPNEEGTKWLILQNHIYYDLPLSQTIIDESLTYNKCTVETVQFLLDEGWFPSDRAIENAKYEIEYQNKWDAKLTKNKLALLK